MHYIVSSVSRNQIKDVRAKIFHRIDFLKIFTADNELLVSEMQKNWGHLLRFRDKACGKLP